MNYTELKQNLEETLAIVGGNKNYGQVIFFAGGAGSGKGFAIDHFINSGSYKVYDVDDLKKKVQKLKSTPEDIKNLDFSPTSVSKLHMYVNKIDLDHRRIGSLLTHRQGQVADGKWDTLPNIILDRTLKDRTDFDNYLVPLILSAGYKPENIHIVWILTDYRVAVQQNLSRERKLTSDLLVRTHEGAAVNMYDMIYKNYPKKINGEVFVILGGKDKTKTFITSKLTGAGVGVQGGYGIAGKDKEVAVNIKDFKYFKIKNAKQPIDDNSKIKKRIMQWIALFAPSLTYRDKYDVKGRADPAFTGQLKGTDTGWRPGQRPAPK